MHRIYKKISKPSRPRHDEPTRTRCHKPNLPLLNLRCCNVMHDLVLVRNMPSVPRLNHVRCPLSMACSSNRKLRNHASSQNVCVCVAFGKVQTTMATMITWMSVGMLNQQGTRTVPFIFLLGKKQEASKALNSHSSACNVFFLLLVTLDNYGPSKPHTRTRTRRHAHTKRDYSGGRM